MTLILGRFNLLDNSNVKIRFTSAGAFFISLVSLVRDEFVLLSHENLACLPGRTRLLPVTMTLVLHITREIRL